MSISLDEALIRLNSTPATIDALMSLINQISVEAKVKAQGAVTVLWGGYYK